MLVERRKKQIFSFKKKRKWSDHKKKEKKKKTELQRTRKQVRGSYKIQKFLELQVSQALISIFNLSSEVADFDK